MEIQSAFNAGVQGLQRASEEANDAATNIARQSTVNASAEESEATAQAPSINSAAPTDLTQSVVDLKVAEYQAKASTEVIQSADESLGTLLDVRV